MNKDMSDQEFNAKLDDKINTWTWVVRISWFLFIIGGLGTIYNIYYPSFWDSHPAIVPFVIGFLGLFAGYLEVWDTKRRRR